MARAGVIVVAPDAAFRHSLIFVLESCGYDALPYDTLDVALTRQQAHDVACAVVDDEAIVHDWPKARELFETFARPVILLIEDTRLPRNLALVRRVTKPFLGERLLQAVQCAVAGEV